MNKKWLGLVAVAAFLSVEFVGAAQADAQGRLFGRLRGRFARTQCCQATCPTDTCGTPAVAVATCEQPISCCQPVASSSGCDSCQQVASSSLEPMPAVGMSALPVTGCQGCGAVQQATYAEPVYAVQGECYGGTSGCGGCGGCVASSGCVASGGCVGCGNVQGTMVEGAVIQGCAAGDCGGVIQGEIVGQPLDGVVVEGGIIEGTVIESGEITSPSDVPEPPSQAPEAANTDKDI